MKIIIGVTSSISYILVRGQIAFLTSYGHEVYFVASPDSEVQADVAREGGVFIPIKMEREINLYKDLISLWKIGKMLRTIKPDIINVSTPKAGLLFTLASKLPCSRAGHKTVFTLRGLRSDTLTGLKRNIIKTTETICCSLADRVIVISPSLMEYAIAKKILAPDKGLVIGQGSSNGIDIDKFRLTSGSLSVASHLRAAHSIPKDALVFGYVGRLVKDKGVRELYEAFVNLSFEYPHIYLLLIGSQDEADILPDALLKEMRSNCKVVLIEFTEQIVDWYAVMDIFVLFSYREGFGNVAIEAAAMNTPVITSDIPGLRDAVVDQQTGLYAKSRDTQDLQAKMKLFCDNHSLISRYGNAGRQRIEKFFNNRSIWRGQLDLYEEVLSNVK